MARKKGAFREVTGTTEESSVEIGGWVATAALGNSFYTGEDNSKTELCWSHLPTVGYKRKTGFAGQGETANLIQITTPNILASGKGWGWSYGNQTFNNPDTGWSSGDILRVVEGREKLLVGLNYFYYLIGGTFSYERHACVVDGRPFCLMPAARFQMDTVPTPKGALMVARLNADRSGWEVVNSVGHNGYVGKAMGANTVAIFSPEKWVVNATQTAIPTTKLWVTTDAGASWGLLSTLTGLWPGLWSALTSLSAAPVDSSAGAMEDFALNNVSNYMLRQAMSVRMHPMRATTAVMVTKYRTRDAENVDDYGGFRVCVSLVNITSGAVIRQRYYDSLDYELTIVYPAGQDTWFEHRVRSVTAPDGLGVPRPGRTLETVSLDLTRDAGVTFTSCTVPANTQSLLIVAKAGGDPIVYFVTASGTVRTVWKTTDMFDTTSERGDITKSAKKPEDHRAIAYIGSPTTPAPCDPVFPWRCQSNFPTPLWWDEPL